MNTYSIPDSVFEKLNKQELEISALQKIMNEILERLREHDMYKIDSLDKKILDLNNLRSEVEFELNRVFKRLDFTSNKRNELDKKIQELEEKLKIESAWRKLSIPQNILFKSDVKVGEKKTGLSFEEAIKEFKKGKKIVFNDGVCRSHIYEPRMDRVYGFDYIEMLENYWEIVE